MVERPASIEEGLPQNAPLVYHFGHTNPSNNSVLYECIVSQMGKIVKERMEKNKKAKNSGLIVNTFGFGSLRGEAKSQLELIASSFGINVIIVLDQERIYKELANIMPEPVKVIWLPKSNGVVARITEQRIEEAFSSIKQYFYGINNTLFPHSYDVFFKELKDGRIFKIGAPSLPSSCMPLGMKAEDNQTKLVPVSLTPKDLLNHVLAVSQTFEKEELIRSNIAGFIVVTGVNLKDEKISILSPQPKPLPQKALLILSDVKYIDR